MHRSTTAFRDPDVRGPAPAIQRKWSYGTHATTPRPPPRHGGGPPPRAHGLRRFLRRPGRRPGGRLRDGRQREPVPPDHRARPRRDHHPREAGTRRHRQLGQPRGAARPRHRPGRHGGGQLRRRRRRRRPPLGRRAPGGTRRRDPRPVRRDRRHRLRGRGRHPARHHPRRLLGADPGGLRHAERDSARRRLPGRRLGHPLARHHPPEQRGHRPRRGGRRADLRHRGPDRRRRRRLPAAPGQVGHVHDPRRPQRREPGRLLHHARHQDPLLRGPRADHPGQHRHPLRGHRPVRPDPERRADRRVRRRRHHHRLRRRHRRTAGDPPERPAAVPHARRGARLRLPPARQLPLATAANPTPLSISWVLEDYVAALADAADRVE